MENVPTSDTGNASNGMSEARHVCKKDQHNQGNKNQRFNNVWPTASMDWRTKTVGVVNKTVLHALRKRFFQARHGVTNILRCLQRVGARSL